MKFVVGVVPADALERVTKALGRAGIYRLTMSEVEVVRPEAQASVRGGEGCLRLEIAVNDAFLGAALEAFEIARSGGDPVWVTVLPIEEIVRIRTGEKGPSAV